MKQVGACKVLGTLSNYAAEEYFRSSLESN